MNASEISSKVVFVGYPENKYIYDLIFAALLKYLVLFIF